MSNAKMPTLLTSYALSQLAGEPHTLIRLLNLQTVLAVGTDAWGRSHIPQPVLVSATISLAEPFASASSSDAVTGSTVHYGVLSKAILGACAEFESLGTKGKEAGNGKSLYALVMYLQAFITGVVSTLQEGEEGGRMRMLEVEVKLLKASLLGSSVSLKGSFVYGDVDSRDNGKKGLVAHSMVLRLHELKIPTLIGVNPNERLAKQMVVADIDIEKWDRIDDDYYKLENLVVQVIVSFPLFSLLPASSNKLTPRHSLRPNSKRSKHSPHTSAWQLQKSLSLATSPAKP